jgi:hypothetical protein
MRVGTLVTAVLACGSGGREFFDRVEGDKAVVVDAQGRQRAVPRDELPENAAEGDVLVDLEPDPVQTEQARRETTARRARLLAGDDGLDFSLEDPRP